ncbi:MAG: hypothetical protein IPK81_08505 [Rhodospirillales bacterium]|nr:MAG: hypothetical protein IPK81_08505 [Rhodospirillales bacterium]
MTSRRLVLASALALGIPAARAQPASRPDWLAAAPRERIADRFPPPPSHKRPDSPADGFGVWLRALPLLPAGAPVLLHDGRPRGRQDGVAAVVDIDVGARDLQQCADAIIRLRAEYLRAAGRMAALSFRFTNGDPYAYADYLAGRRPVPRGAGIAWSTAARAADTRAAFRHWLDIVFTYAGTLSLARELAAVREPARIEAGDVLIQPGSPGHAIVAVDVATRPDGGRIASFAQSFMPAQSVHVLRGPVAGAWYPVDAGQPIDTPDWRFAASDLRRFPTV